MPTNAQPRLPNPTTYAGWLRAYNKARENYADLTARHYLESPRFEQFRAEHTRRIRERTEAMYERCRKTQARETARAVKKETKKYTYEGWKRLYAKAKREGDSAAVRRLSGYEYYDYTHRYDQEKYDAEEAKKAAAREKETRASEKYKQARTLKNWYPIARAMANGGRFTLTTADPTKFRDSTAAAHADRAASEAIRIMADTPEREASRRTGHQQRIVHIRSQMLQADYFRHHAPTAKARAEWERKHFAAGALLKQEYPAAYAEELRKVRAEHRARDKAAGVAKEARSKHMKRTPSKSEEHYHEVHMRYLDAARAYRDNRTEANKRKAQKAHEAFRALDRYREKREKRPPL